MFIFLCLLASQSGAFPAASSLRCNSFWRRLCLQSFQEWVLPSLLPAYHGLPCIKILIVGVSAIIHFFPNGMLASDKEPLGKTVCVICQLISSLGLSVAGRFSHSPLADGETEAQNRVTSLSLLISNTTMDSPYQTTSRHHPHGTH